MGDARMRGFWNARAREDAFYFVDTRQRYRAPNEEAFWDAAELLDYSLEQLRAELRPGDTVLEIGCGIGRFTRVLAARARTVIALDVSDEMLALARRHCADLRNVQWVLGDGVSLVPLEQSSIDACVSFVVFQHFPSSEVALGYVRELGRVLRPGGWAALQVSTDPLIHHRRPWLRPALRAVARRGPRGTRNPAWLGSHLRVGDVREVALGVGLRLERVWAEGSQYSLLLLRRKI